MARIRTLKPEFWDSPSTAQADLAVRLTFMAMWNWADDSGHGTANLKELEAFCFPNDEVTELPRRGRGNSAGTAGGWRSFAEVCGEVAEVYGVVFYRVKGRPYYWITSFKQHQSKDYRATSRYPTFAEGEAYDVTSGNALPEGARNILELGSSGNSAGTAGDTAEEDGKAAPGIGEQGNRGTEEQGNRGGGDDTPPPPPSGRKKPAKPIPEDWSPTTAHEEKAQQLGLDVHGIADEFVNWAISKDERKADWSAAFHNWLTREAKWSKEGTSRSSIAPKGQAKEDANLANLADWVQSKQQAQDALPFPGGDPA